MWQAEGQRIWNRVHWRSMGDKGNKEFYWSVQPKSATTRITNLKLDENGIPQSSQVAMENICYTFYSCLYVQRMEIEENRLDSSKIL